MKTFRVTLDDNQALEVESAAQRCRMTKTALAREALLQADRREDELDCKHREGGIRHLGERARLGD